MGRLIDEDSVKRRMHETMDYQDLYLPVHFEMCMNDAPTIEHASPWHRVEDGLPKAGEFGEIVLACNDAGTVNAAFLSSNGKWYAANNTMYDAWTWMPNVTHWMPFPEPPKEDQPNDYDPCYECGGYGDDYHIDEDGELVSNCPDCPFNKKEGEK